MKNRRVFFALVVAGIFGSGAAAQDLETRLQLEYALAQARTGFGQVNQQALQATLEAARMSMAGTQLSLAESRLALVRALAGVPLPDAEWFPADSADELFRRAREELRRRNHQIAAELFHALQTDFPESSYVGQAMYFEAFALNRIGGDDRRRRAVDLLDRVIREHPDLSDQAASLRMQTLGQLGRQGDAEAAAQLASAADRITAERDNQRAVIGVATEPSRLARGGTPVVFGQYVQESEDVRLQALNALLQMDSENAMPILRRVLLNREGQTVELRRRAVFLVAQKRSGDREQILLDAARNDPDGEVREQAVFFLSQVHTDAAVDALDSILQRSTEERLQERAIFALSQHRSERAGQILQRYARRTDTPVDLRASAIQWIGQRRGNEAFLRGLYAELTDSELKNKVLFAMSQGRSEENAAFLIGIATDATEPMELRKQALFWAGQTRVADDRLYRMYGEVADDEMKEQLIFVYGQRRDSLAVNRLIEIARDGSNIQLQGKAIFWLGQSRDPRAIAVLEEIINRDDRQ